MLEIIIILIFIILIFIQEVIYKRVYNIEALQNIKIAVLIITVDYSERFKNEIAQNKVKIIRADNREAAKNIPDNLDMVYIDANHAYEEIKKDLEAWYPKVRAGGIFSGDDYFYYDTVVKAVDEFFNNHPELTLNISESKTQWWCVKG